VKISPGLRCSRRKLPPEILVLGIAVVAISRAFLNPRDHSGSQRSQVIVPISDFLIISLFPVPAIKHSLDAITKVGDMKVDQKAYILTA